MSNKVGRRNCTAKALAARLGVSVRVVQKYTSIDRAEYEANSITRAAPWAAMGISRRTWYNRGKPTPTQQTQENPT
jgi:transcriptional regulator with XRE-family HTH domain